MSAVVHPDPSESLEGYLRRIAEAEMWPDLADFLASFGLRYGRPLIEQARDVEERLGLPEGTLRDILPSATPKVPSRNWRFERHHCAPVCPGCISEGKPHHHSWRHTFVTACAEHGLKLVDECPMCRENFLPGRGGYDSCHCGCPLDRLPRHEAGLPEVALSALIAGDMQPARSALPPALAFRTPIDIGEFVYFLAGGEVETETGKHGKTPLPKTLEETAGFLAPAFAVLCDWPTGFEHTVSVRLSASDAPTAPMRLGKWYQRMMQFGGVAYADFRNALAGVVSREFNGAYVGGACPSGQPRDWISAAEAAKQLGIRAERLVDAVAKGVIDGEQHSSGFGHRHTMITRPTVEAIAANRGNFIDKTTAREFLGISRKQYDLIFSAGLFGASLPNSPPALVSGPHDLRALKEIVHRIAVGARACDGETITFKSLNLRFTTDISGLAAVYQRVADHSLRPVVNTTEGKLAAFHFSKAEVDKILAETRRGPGFTVQELARMTGWKDQCVAQWCKQGLIQHDEFPHAGKTGRVISMEALSRFQTEYVPVSILAAQLGTSPRHAMAKLSQAGVQTVGAFQEGGAWRGHLVSIAALGKLAIYQTVNSARKRGTA